MTRINVIHVESLSDKHLLAEYKEITRPFNKVLKRIEKHGMSKALDDVIIPEKYCLGKGHESFFFNKLSWLIDRYAQLFDELVERGINVNRQQFGDIFNNFYDSLEGTSYWNDYTPTPEDMYLNMARLCKRSGMENVIDELYSDS